MLNIASKDSKRNVHTLSNNRKQFINLGVYSYLEKKLVRSRFDIRRLDDFIISYQNSVDMETFILCQ